MYVILHTYKALPWHVECVTLILVHIPLQSILHEFLSNGLTKVMTWSSRDWHSYNVIVASACGVQVGTWELAVGRDRRMHIWGIFDIVKYWEGHILVSRDHDPQLCLCDLQEAELTLKQLENDWSQEWSLLMTRTHRMSPCRIFLSIVVDNLFAFFWLVLLGARIQWSPGVDCLQSNLVWQDVSRSSCFFVCFFCSVSHCSWRFFI